MTAMTSTGGTTRTSAREGERAGGRVRGERRGRQAEGRERKSIPAPAFINRKLSYFDLLREEELVRIERHVDWLLEDVGMAFRENTHALDVWRQLGAKVEDTLVRVDAGLVRELLTHAPAKFTQVARNPARSVEIGGSSQVFAPVYGPPFVRDQAGGRRYGTMQDLENFVKIVHQLPSLHHSGLVICEPCDVPVSKRHLDMLYLHMRYGDRPHLGAITTKERAQDSVDMARLLHGEETFNNNCVIMGNVNTNSPLLIDQVVSEAIEVYCGNGQGIVVTPFILCGAMGPVTLAASIAQAVAESMICGAYAQAIRKGAPFVMGNFLSSMSLKSGAPTFGMPEPTLSNLVIGHLARRLNLPLRCGGGLTASKIPDFQAAAESADSMLSTAMAGANFVLHSAGWLEGGLCTGYEKLVLDADRLGGYQKFLGGLELDDNQLAVKAYEEVKPGGHFLGSSHTMDNYQTAFYEPALSDSENVESWEERGAKDAYTRAYERWQSLLNDYVPAEIDPGLDQALQDHVRQRKDDLPDQWY